MLAPARYDGGIGLLVQAHGERDGSYDALEERKELRTTQSKERAHALAIWPRRQDILCDR